MTTSIDETPNPSQVPADLRPFLASLGCREDPAAWLQSARRAAGCASPVRLRGESVTVDTSTGEVVDRFASREQPDGLLYIPCGTRRASACPACAETYRADTYQLLRAGLTGGKSVPQSVAAHPAVFLTLTAPGFGPVHTRRTGRGGRVLPCRPRREDPLCEHGRRLSCPRAHGEDERALGKPLCVDCYDYSGQVVWNSSVSELWRRTKQCAERSLKQLAPACGCGRRVRVSYAKVAEYQARGVVHLHALVRLDGRDPDDADLVLPPPAGLTVADLIDALRDAAASANFTTPPHPDRPEGWRLTWGTQVDVRIINAGLPGELTSERVAGYLAKYATKSTEAVGLVARRLNAATVRHYADGTHAGRLIWACWRLGRPETDYDWDRLRRWAHMLGFGGHFSTRSRRFSSTLKSLREARRDWRRSVGRVLAGLQPEPQDLDAEGEASTLVVNAWSFAGTGWFTGADAELAIASAAAARAH